MEAGVEHFSRSGGTLARADALIVVCEPFFKSIVTARQVAELGGELEIPWRYVVGNKVRHDEDLAEVRRFADEVGLPLLGWVPWDRKLEEAELRGQAPIDFAPDSPGVTAVRNLVDGLLADLAPAVTAG